jgi:hypothetical protein
MVGSNEHQLGGNRILHLHAFCKELVNGDTCAWQNDSGKFPATQNVVSQHMISTFSDKLYDHVLETGHEVIVSGERK